MIFHQVLVKEIILGLLLVVLGIVVLNRDGDRLVIVVIITGLLAKLGVNLELLRRLRLLILGVEVELSWLHALSLDGNALLGSLLLICLDLLLLLFDECLLAILNKADSSFDLLLQERTIRTFAVSINVHLVFFALKLINNFTGKVFMDVLTFIIMEWAFIVLIEVVVLFFLGFIRVFRAVTRSRIVLLLGILR